MPELPEVETTVRGLARFLAGERIARIAVNRPDLRRPFPPDLVQALSGARVTALGRRAKYGLVHTDRERTMIFHLGMSGRWRTEGGEPGKHDHLLIETMAGRRLFLHDPRRFGSVDLVAGPWDTGFAPFAALGPEPLSDAFDARVLTRALAGKATPIKLALLDQRVVAGLGNIYVCEALNMAGIAPGRAGGQISTARLEKLVAAIKEVLAAAIEAGGSTLRDYAQPDGELGYFSKQFDVYDRHGQNCTRCGAPVQRLAQGGRSTWYCAKCQK